ncbi:protein phosphatase PTC7 homolog [Halyomorpha halys]|uniref:protein phosphatase PTC7 homolog n=1 Tax=Halyomorpha halys TaxID=286706 RepID=UPI0006D4D9BA|nr:protein phosphatase PTC7 homolog [Halyomorpha halys]
MQAITWTGRILSRAIWNGINNYSTNCTEPSPPLKKYEPHILSVVSGFPKEISQTKLKKGQFGDDAWFTAKFKTADVLGVADGVGGWRNYGIDPGEFSSFLMRTCERLVISGRFRCAEPANLLAHSYYELLENKQPVLGSSTACVVVLNRDTSTVYTANIGDSGFVIVRHGEVVHRSEEQQHYFNTPYQLSLPPPGHSRLVLNDRPESANTTNFRVQDGDVILLATDGVFDNVPDQILLNELKSVEGVRDPLRLQSVANSIALMARKLAFDQTFMSPFAKAARANGINIIGGKPDDITVLLATVAM